VRNTWRLACAVAIVCLWAPAAGQAQAPTTETCPPPASAAGTIAAPNTSSSRGALRPAPTQLLACVGSQSIAGSLFRHWAGVAKRAEGRRAKTRAAIEQVMSFLISSDWVIDEAQALKVHASDVEVRRRFDHIRHQQFPKRREFNAFLKSSGQTVADLLLRVRLNLLSERIQRQVLSGQPGARARENALTQFAKEFQVKWRAQTYCSPAYAVSDCGHVQTVL
jgi:hypothetical protein